MKVLHSKYPAHDIARSLILMQRTTTTTGRDEPIIFQQSCLGLAQDQHQVVLRRYVEHYSPDSGHWVEYAHAVPTAELIAWIMAHGQLRIACSEGAEGSQVHV